MGGRGGRREGWGPEGESYKMQRFRGARALRSYSDEGVENGEYRIRTSWTLVPVFPHAKLV